MESKNILEHFSDLPEPREDNKRHELLDIISIIICGSICGADTWEDIASFGESKEEWFRRFLKLPHGIPSKDTLRRVFASIDPEELSKRFNNWIEIIVTDMKDEIINIDGKTLRRSHDRSNGKSAIHMVSAWANKAGMVLGQVKVNEKSNEITAIPELLNFLEISGCIVTIDAMGTQKEIAKTIISKDADYVLALKGNQGTLHQDISFYFDKTTKGELNKKPFDYYKSFNKDHGRIETREYWATDEIDWLPMKSEWEGLNSVCMVKNTRTINNVTSSEIMYYISSLPPDAKKLGTTIRSHWGVENSLHWVLDMAFREDECRKRIDNSTENFAVLRHLTLNLLKQEKTCKRSIAGKRLKAGWDNNYLEKVLFRAK